MPKLLFHSYHFPPIGGSGAQRPLKMVRYLDALGFQSTVVTSGGATTDRWAPEDPTLAAEIPATAKVYRVEQAGEPEQSTGLRRAADRWLGVRDRWSAWWADASYDLGREVGRDADVIYVWMQPYASAEAGSSLSKALGKPWVADLGDPWALDELMIFPSAAHRGRELRRMRRLLGTAAAIVMSTPEAVARLRQAFPELEGRPITCIPNGFDAADFARNPPARVDGKFRIVHTGYLHTELGERHRRRRRLRELLRASPRGLDMLTRSHVFLIEAINELLSRRPELRDIVEFHLAGVMNDHDLAVARRCPVVELHGYVTHAEAIELMQTANLLFLPMQNLPPGTRATIVPGKTYDYLASGTPILAAVPDGDAKEIVDAAGNGFVVRPDDVDGMCDAIAAEIARSRDGSVRLQPDPQLVERFEYRTLARQLADVFDAVLAR